MTPDRWQQIETLFHDTWGRPAGDRAGFLAAACPDPEMRRYVEVLLGEAESPRGQLALASLDIHPDVLASLTPPPLTGRTLGTYRLDALIGAGGMGEVYRAHDTRLGRDVAIKVLPRALTNDPDRLTRFDREARILAALNHPNICGIYGFEEQADLRFLVLELVDGETLDAKLPLRLREALEAARLIALALEAAHERGVIHRDLKPANVKITSTSNVKVLDFGLAKELDVDRQPLEITLSPVSGDRGVGAFMGTTAYMSPEQATGAAVDKRADIWAFGVLLFEMLAGTRPFRGETVTETVAAIIKSEPDWDALPRIVPPDLAVLLRRCLQKDPRRRLQSIADARVQIEELIRTLDSDAVAVDRPHRAGLPPPSSRRGVTHPGVAWTVAGIAALVAAALGVSLVRRPQEPSFSLQVVPQPGVSLATEEAPIIAPDGQTLAFVAYDGRGTQRLHVYRLGGAATARPLDRTQGASLPFWSPDGRSIGFFAEGHLKTVDITTGGTKTLANAGGARGGTWNLDDVIVYAPSPRDGPYRVSATQDPVPQRIPSDSAIPAGGWFPSFLPDGRHFLEFVPTVSQPENSGVWVVSLETGRRERLIDSQSNAVYAPPGYVLFWQRETLWALPFDADTRKRRGNPVRVADAVGLNPVTNQALFSVSPTGTLAYFAGAVGFSELIWFDRKGLEQGRPGATGVISTITLSPDGTRVVYDQADPLTATFDLWQLVFGRRTPDKLTFNPSNDVFPVFAPDGSRLAFSSVRQRPPQMYELATGSSGTETLLLKNGLPTVPSGWSRDGRWLYYTVTDPKTLGGDIWSVSLDTGSARAIVNSADDERYGTPSPDGRWLAYVSNETGTYEVFVRGLHSTTTRQISTGGGSQPLWRSDGSELFYMARDRALMAVEFGAGPEELPAGATTRLFATRTKSLEIQGTQRTYAVASDGRFLVANATEASAAASITVTLRWPSSITP